MDQNSYLYSVIPILLGTANNFEDKWNTTEASGMKLSHSCPTFAELSASMKEKGINKCNFLIAAQVLLICLLQSTKRI